MMLDRENCRSNPPPHLSCKFFHFETYVPKPAKGLVFGGGGPKIEEFFANEEIKEMCFFSTYEQNSRRISRKRRNRRNIGSNVPKLAQRPVLGGGVQISKNSSQMKKAKKCVFLHVRRELAKNSTQTKKWKKCWVICFQGGQRAGVRGGQEIEEIFATQEIEEILCSSRPRRTRQEFHANEEIEEMLSRMFPSWPNGRN